jgi:GNAT superfamily N-acetyltransferase
VDYVRRFVSRIIKLTKNNKMSTIDDKIEIKKVDSINVNRYNFLRKSVNWREVCPEFIETGFLNSINFVAEEEGEIIGLTRIVTDGGYFNYLSDVIVLPEYQGRGIGRLLMEKAMEYLKNRITLDNCMYVALTAAADKESFYQKFGFVVLPNGDKGAGMSQYLTKNIIGEDFQ